MNGTGIEVGDIELIMRRIEGDIAETGTAVCDTAQRNIGEFRNLAGCTINTPDRARTSTKCGAKLAFHEAGTGLAGVHTLRNTIGVIVGDDDLQAMHGRRRRVDVGLRRIVKRHAEHLPDVAGKGLEFHRRAHDLGVRFTFARHAEYLERRAVGIDEGLAVHVLCPGKTGYGEIAAGHDTVLGPCAREGQHHGEQ